jgi:hypothetical protein
MAISVINVIPNPTIPPRVAQGGLQVLSGIVECRFRGDVAGTGRDTLTFNVGPVTFSGQSGPPIASCTVSLASFGFDGAGYDGLWAVDSAEVGNFVNQDKSSGTAELEVVANLAVRSHAALVLRVNYSLFYTPS